LAEHSAAIQPALSSSDFYVLLLSLLFFIVLIHLNKQIIVHCCSLWSSLSHGLCLCVRVSV